MCDKIKEIKRLLDVIKITDWSEIGDRIDEIKLIFDDIEKPKRNPLPDGTLPLTDEELEEFSEIVKDRGVHRVWIGENDVAYYKFNKGIYQMNGNAVKIKAILWLAERFELTSNN